MTVLKKKYVWIPLLTVLFLSVVIAFVSAGMTSEKHYTVQPRPFEVSISVKGEVQGKNAVMINLPDILKNRAIRIWGLKIKDLVPEGTIVKQGEWVATLDAGEVNKRIQENRQDLSKFEAEFNDARIDSAIQLTKLREELEEFTYDLEYKKIELEQAKYESPAYQRKKQVEYNKTVRQMNKKQRDYELKRIELKVKTKRSEDKFKYHNKRDSILKKAVMACRVKSPKDGMVMYARFWGGRKIRIGDEVYPWNPAIATLPDMSVLVSETYVQEIDITKIATGDSVSIRIDALPDYTYSGVISKIANIGQEIPGFDTKVFKVMIDMTENGEELKPSMTTDNKIILDVYQDVLAIPRELIHIENGDAFVYLKKGRNTWKKRIELGDENEEQIVVKSGLEINDEVLQVIPKNADEIGFLDNHQI